tara:strand:+ start:309 stop:479 length:171 start_codon:yes stop_codon:yes gene_type:complete
MKKLGMIGIAIWLYSIAAWVINLVKLLNCDFDPIDKSELIHLAGLMGPVAWVTCWF